MAALRESLREYFGLRRAEEQAARADAPALASARAALWASRQKAAAAEVLYPRAHPAEALALARDALALALRAADVPGTTVDPALRERAGALASSACAPEFPALDADVTAAHRALFAPMLDARAALERALGDAVLPPADVRALRRLRISVVAALGLAVLGVAAWALFVRNPLRATASGYVTVDGGFPPAHAIDGDAATEWILPDHTPGWIDLWLARPMDVRAVRILNAHNRQFLNVATRDYRVELYAGPRLVNSATGVFTSILAAPDWEMVPVRAERVTRVRVLVLSWHGAAGGLAELRIE